MCHSERSDESDNENIMATPPDSEHTTGHFFRADFTQIYFHRFYTEIKPVRNENARSCRFCAVLGMTHLSGVSINERHFMRGGK